MSNKSANRGRLLFPLFSTLAVICFCMTLYQFQRFTALSDCVQVRFKQPSLTIEDVQQALENEREHKGDVSDATLWSDKKEESIENEKPYTASLRVLLVYGDAARAYNATYLSGSNPAMGDSIGCAVDQKAADALFGSNDVVGNTLIWQENFYTVRGVFEGMEGVVIVQANDQDKSKFDALSLAVASDANGRETAESFLLSNGLMIPDAVIDAPFLVQLLKALSLLPAWIISITIVVKMFLYLKRMRQAPLHLILAAIASVAVSILMFYVAQCFFPISDRLIPTKWSDFSFWSKLLDQIRFHAEQVRGIEPLLSDLMRNSTAQKCTLYSCGAAVLYASAMATKPTFNTYQLLLFEICMIVAIFLTLIVLSALGRAVSAPRALWLTWPLYIMIENVLSFVFNAITSKRENITQAIN